VIRLAPAPAAHSVFAGWSGCTTQVGDECRIYGIVADRVLTAAFDPIQRALRIERTGSGSVSCDTGSGPGPCAPTYPEGTSIALTATAGAGSTFAGFSGGGCSGAGTCALTLDADTTVTAAFDIEALSLAPLSVLTPGTAIVARVARVRGSAALVRLSCRGGGPCRGVLRLFARLPRGAKKHAGKARGSTRRRRAKVRIVLIGSAPFGLPAGASRTLGVKIANRGARRLLRRRRKLAAQVRGTGIEKRALRLRWAGGNGKRR
jgi:hypothetical protein